MRSGAFIDDLDGALAELRAIGARTRVLFLDASDDVLVRRFEESRRRHPLADDRTRARRHRAGARAARGAQGRGRPRRRHVELNVHELRDRLVDLFGATHAATRLQVDIVSFGYKHGLPLDVDLVFDCRFLPEPALGRLVAPAHRARRAGARYVLEPARDRRSSTSSSGCSTLLLPAYVREGKSYLSIGVGCTGGRHRSVVIAEELARRLEPLGFPAHVHRPGPGT